MISRVQRTSARLELMLFLSFLTWVQIVQSPMYPSDSFGLTQYSLNWEIGRLPK